MSDASGPRCGECGESVYFCTCWQGTCLSCGAPLPEEEREAGRDECFGCYMERND